MPIPKAPTVTLPALTILATLILFPQFAPAQTTAWQAGISSWFTPANWNAGLPNSTVTANVDNAGEPLISSGSAAAATPRPRQHLDLHRRSLHLQHRRSLRHQRVHRRIRHGQRHPDRRLQHRRQHSLHVQQPQSASGIYNLSAGSLTTANLFIGYGGPNANFSQFGGSLSVTQNLSVFNQAALFINNASDTVHFTHNVGTITLGGATSTAAPGNLNSTTGFDETATATLSLTLGGPTPQTQDPQIPTSPPPPSPEPLDVFLGNNFTPFPGETFNLITSTSHTGILSHVFLPTLPQNELFTYTPTAVVLTIVPETHKPGHHDIDQPHANP